MSTAVGSEPDFHPLLGGFDVPVYELTITVGSRTITGRFGVLPESLSSILTMFGLNGWILGSDFFRDRSIILDLDHDLVVDVTETLAERKRLDGESNTDPMQLSDRTRFDNRTRPRFTSRSTLTMSTRDALDYHRNSFDNDLRRVIGGDTATWPRLSITSFCPGNRPRVPMYSEPARAFALLEDQCWFLCSLFSAQLIDQASHSATGTARQVRAGTRGEIRLVGMLGSYWNTMHPAFLLLVLGLYRLRVSDETIADGIQKTVTAELESLIATPEERDRVYSEIYNAIRPGQIPDSLRAFMLDKAGRHQEPEMMMVERLRMAASSAIESVSSRHGVHLCSVSEIEPSIPDTAPRHTSHDTSDMSGVPPLIAALLSRGR